MVEINDVIIKELGLQPSIEQFEFIPDDWVLTPIDVANLTGMSAITIRRWCREGKIPSYQFQRKYVITGKEFKKFLKRAKIQSKFIRRMKEL
ncbi:helix-turn-helix domain-containing protein [Ureibacillus sp. GCM10028918]|uniref:helix-turn-helix domain-containing protein n=1 Tax=Ureibacillus sp. GCM10028918 TaxID=3273429 RepID=UPI00361B2DB2